MKTNLIGAAVWCCCVVLLCGADSSYCLPAVIFCIVLGASWRYFFVLYLGRRGVLFCIVLGASWRCYVKVSCLKLQFVGHEMP